MRVAVTGKNVCQQIFLRGGGGEEGTSYSYNLEKPVAMIEGRSYLGWGGAGGSQLITPPNTYFLYVCIQLVIWCTWAAWR